jgi:hypothetical protein
MLIKELAYLAKETNNITVSQYVALLIAHNFKELVDLD